MSTSHHPPLEGTLVIDLSRMLPGAVLARQLIDLGARLIKIEDPVTGDLMRHAPPKVGGIGVGFAALLRGAESLCLDLRDPADAAKLRRIVRSADVLVESFRPGTMERWDLGPDQLLAIKAGLVYCSLSSFGREGPGAGRVGHDLNFVAESGALRLMCDHGVPRIQLADISSGLLATSAILAALLARHHSGRGAVIDQPLAAGPLPFVTWAWAEAWLDRPSVLETVLGGRCPCYRSYACADGTELAVAAVEPKFWIALVELLDLPHLAGAGIETGEDGEEAALAVAQALAARPREHWLALAAEHGLPLSAVNTVEAALSEPSILEGGLVEDTPTADGGHLATAGPYLPSLGRTPQRPAPQLGEHTDAILKEFGLSD